MTIAVQPMKKLRLQITPGNTSGAAPGGDPVTVEFIYGVASDGLSPFESVLSGKKKGDTMSLSVATSGARDYFGNCLGNFQQLFGLAILPSTIYLTVEIEEILDAKNREVVQALAKSLSHRCGGSCDCGCS